MRVSISWLVKFTGNGKNKSDEKSENYKYEKDVGNDEVEVQFLDLFEDDVYELEEKEDVWQNCEVQVQTLHDALMPIQAMLFQVSLIHQIIPKVSDVVEFSCQCENSQIPEIIDSWTKGQSFENSKIHLNIHSFLKSKDKDHTIRDLVEPILCIKQQVTLVQLLIELLEHCGF